MMMCLNQHKGRKPIQNFEPSVKKTMLTQLGTWQDHCSCCNQEKGTHGEHKTS